jgi:hypothetical protein
VKRQKLKAETNQYSMRLRMTDKEGSLKEISEKLEAINETLKKAFVESKEPKKNEEREFQVDMLVKMLRLQLKYDNANLVMTVILSLIVSLLAVFATITFSGVFPPAIFPIALTATILLIVATFLCPFVVWLVSHIAQKTDLDKLQKHFVEKYKLRIPPEGEK